MRSAECNLLKTNISKRGTAMKIISVISVLLLFVVVMMLSGCIFPYWGDEGGGGHGGGHRGGGYGEGGHHGGGERH